MGDFGDYCRRNVILFLTHNGIVVKGCSILAEAVPVSVAFVDGQDPFGIQALSLIHI